MRNKIGFGTEVVQLQSMRISVLYRLQLFHFRGYRKTIYFPDQMDRTGLGNKIFL